MPRLTQPVNSQSLTGLCTLHLLMCFAYSIELVYRCLEYMQQSSRTVYIKNHNKLCTLPIGCIACLCAAPMFSDKLIVIKKTNLYFVAFGYVGHSTLYIAAGQLHFVQFAGSLLTVARRTYDSTIASSILLDYLSYSQVE